MILIVFHSWVWKILRIRGCRASLQREEASCGRFAGGLCPRGFAITDVNPSDALGLSRSDLGMSDSEESTAKV